VSAAAFECVLDARASLGEGPVWSLVEQVLYWIDINAPALHRFDPATGHNTTVPLPSSIGCFALRRSGGFVLALRDGIWQAGPDGKPARQLAAAPYDTQRDRFNDGRCDPQGRFWVGSINEAQDTRSGVLVRLCSDASLARVVDDIVISNGLAWSPDGRTMYHTDTPSRTIHAYDFDPDSGTPSNRRVFHAFSGSREHPDGATVDSEGCYWIALYGAARVVRIASDGRVIAEHPLPVDAPTMCAFGGRDLRTLYVTSARQHHSPEDLARWPLSGGLFALHTDVPGLPEPYFAG
jgi:sugar lactone lactonase YvrE